VIRPGHGLSPLFPRDERDGPRARAGGRFINAWAEWSRGDTGTRARVAAYVYMHLCVRVRIPHSSCVENIFAGYRLLRRVASHRVVAYLGASYEEFGKQIQ